MQFSTKDVETPTNPEWAKKVKGGGGDGHWAIGLEEEEGNRSTPGRPMATAQNWIDMRPPGQHDIPTQNLDEQI